MDNDPISQDIEDLDPREDVWSGGDNIQVNIDHSKSSGGEEVTPSPETLDIVGDTGVYRMAESTLRKIIRGCIR